MVNFADFQIYCRTGSKLSIEVIADEIAAMSKKENDMW